MSIQSKLISRPILLASAVFLLNTGNALAAGDPADPQAQARELLSGAANRAVTPGTSGALANGTHQPTLEPQEQARRLILGTPRSGTGSNSISSDADSRRIRHAYRDAHALAERLLGGKAA